jgi:hypothetical protein
MAGYRVVGEYLASVHHTHTANKTVTADGANGEYE